MMDKPNCADCINSYQGADMALRCRVHSNGLKCSPAAAEDCKRFIREPGADSDDSSKVWFAGAWCEGRGD